MAPIAVSVATNTSSCGPWLETEAVFTCDLAILTFRLLSFVTGHSCHALRANFQLSMAFYRTELRVQYGTNDGHRGLSALEAGA